MAQRASPFLGGLLTGLLAGGLLWLLIARPRGVPIELDPPPAPPSVRVHVAGAVARPGVYVLPAGAIVGQALEAAGGAIVQADLSHLNLAAPVAEGQQVLVPRQGTPLPSPDAAAAAPQTGLLDLNRATAPELERLPGIGPVLAQNIVDHRERYGPFRAVEDLLAVSGIGPARLEQLRSLVTVAPPG